jgi:short-subunit dehydrogenase
VRRALVTGAADGIGRALALQLVERGFEVVGVDRDVERSRDVASVRFLHGDLGVEGDVRRLGALLADEPPFHLVAHVAGISSVGPFEASDPVAARDVVAVNLLAPLLLTSRLVAAGRVEPEGTIVFVSSLSRWVGYPGAAVYAATKDGLASYARSLSVACAPRRIHVLAAFPGPTRTAHARRYAPPGSREDARMPPEDVARAILRAADRRRPRVVPGLRNRLAARFGTLFPRTMDRIMLRLLFQPVRSRSNRAP